MSDQQRADYELAFNEIRHALQQHGESESFWEACDEVEERLIEMVATWLVKLGVHPEGSLQGFV